MGHLPNLMPPAFFIVDAGANDQDGQQNSYFLVMNSILSKTLFITFGVLIAHQTTVCWERGQ